MTVKTSNSDALKIDDSALITPINADRLKEGDVVVGGLTPADLYDNIDRYYTANEQQQIVKEILPGNQALRIATENKVYLLAYKVGRTIGHNHLLSFGKYELTCAFTDKHMTFTDSQAYGIDHCPFCGDPLHGTLYELGKE